MDIAQVVLKGSPQALQAAHKAILLALEVVQSEHPILYEWDDCGFMDDVGGHHDNGCGWAPDGTYCGECPRSSCRDCKIWEHKSKYCTLKGAAKSYVV